MTHELRQFPRPFERTDQVDHKHPFNQPMLDEFVERLERLEEAVFKTRAVPAVESPYLNADEAAAYLRVSVNALYGLVERRKLRPLPGHRKYRFTRAILDAFLQGV